VGAGDEAHRSLRRDQPITLKDEPYNHGQLFRRLHQFQQRSDQTHTAMMGGIGTDGWLFGEQ